jgi:hypothetical protein
MLWQHLLRHVYAHFAAHQHIGIINRHAIGEYAAAFTLQLKRESRQLMKNESVLQEEVFKHLSVSYPESGARDAPEKKSVKSYFGCLATASEAWGSK